MIETGVANLKGVVLHSNISNHTANSTAAPANTAHAAPVTRKAPSLLSAAIAAAKVEAKAVSPFAALACQSTADDRDNGVYKAEGMPKSRHYNHNRDMDPNGNPGASNHRNDANAAEFNNGVVEGHNAQNYTHNASNISHHYQQQHYVSGAAAVAAAMKGGVVKVMEDGLGHRFRTVRWGGPPAYRQGGIGRMQQHVLQNHNQLHQQQQE